MDTHEAALIVTHTVRCVGRKRVFNRLKASVLAAQTVHADEFIATLCPTEYDILSDPTIVPTIRFRFGGNQFPPNIYYKIFLKNTGASIKHFSAQEILSTNDMAAEDAYNQMGHKKYMEQLMHDTYLHNHHGLSDASDVTDAREYQQLMGILDKRSAFEGGKANDWRSISLFEPTASSSKIVSDFVEHVNSNGESDFQLTKTYLDASKLIPDKISVIRAQSAKEAMRKELGPSTARLPSKQKERKMAKFRMAYILPNDSGHNLIVYDSGTLEKDTKKKETKKVRQPTTTIGKSAPPQLPQTITEDQPPEKHEKEFATVENGDENFPHMEGDDALFDWSQNLDPMDANGDLDHELLGDI
eukprot:m.11836 g.11836  ORF g.11836 m.11836 type:complete len:358 (-) comp3897_c0_seq1:169-1242(-)